MTELEMLELLRKIIFNASLYADQTAAQFRTALLDQIVYEIYDIKQKQYQD